MLRYARPGTLDEALGLLGEDRWRILSGGTDFYPALGAKPVAGNVLDINGLSELRGITETPTHFSIGARTTWSDLIGHPLPAAFDALKQAAREVGSVQIQNTGTVAGNICNASPAADGVPPLLVLDAEVELRSAGDVRLVPLERFVLGNRSTAIHADQMVTAIRVPRQSAFGTSAFHKLGARRYLVISIAMAAVRLVVDEAGDVQDAAIAVGSCSAVAQRLFDLEEALVGLPAGPALSVVAGRAEFAELTPIDDVRASAGYRRDAAREIVCRALLAASGFGTETVAA